MLVSLTALRDACRATIHRVDAEFAVRRRLAALGVKPGRGVELVRRFGATGPLQLRVDRTDVVLRAAEAARIEVEADE